MPPADKKVRVYIEIEKHSNKKYEYNHATNKLELDRFLPYPYIYPFPYGFIFNTKAADGDELDVLILTDKPVQIDTTHDVYIVGVLIMEDEKGMDEKILCVYEEDYVRIHDLSSVDMISKFSIQDFFTNYKTNTEGKWSKVHGFQDKAYAIALYESVKI